MENSEDVWARRIALVIIFPYILVDGLVIATGLILERIFFGTRPERWLSFEFIKDLKSEGNTRLVRPYLLGGIFYVVIVIPLVLRIITL